VGTRGVAVKAKNSQLETWKGKNLQTADLRPL